MCNSGGSQDFGCILIQVRNTEIWCDDWCVENDWNDAETTLTSSFVYLTYRFYKEDESYPFWMVVIRQVFKFGHNELRMMAAWLFELARMTANLDDTFLKPRWDGVSTIAVYSIINRFGARFKCLRLRHLANAGNLLESREIWSTCYLGGAKNGRRHRDKAASLYWTGETDNQPVWAKFQLWMND